MLALEPMRFNVNPVSCVFIHFPTHLSGFLISDLHIKHMSESGKV